MAKKGRLSLSVAFFVVIAVIVALCLDRYRNCADIPAVSRVLLLYLVSVAIWSVLFLIGYALVAIADSRGHFDAGHIRSVILIAVFALTVLQPVSGWALGVEAKVPNFENRELAAKPVFDIGAITTLPQSLEAYFNDHFGFRKTLMHWNSEVMVRLFHTSTVPQVVLGKNDWLFYGDGVKEYQGLTRFTDGQLYAIRRSLEQQRDWLAERGIPYLIVVPPDKETVYPEYLPETVKVVNQPGRLDQLLEYLHSNSDIEILDLREALLEAKSLYPVYYRTDTHWNSYGAFVGYLEIMKRLSAYYSDLKPLSMSDCHVAMEPAHQAGDLSNMLAMHDVLVDDELPQLTLDADAVSSQKKLKSAVVFWDSFFVGLEPYLSMNFEQIIKPDRGQGFDPDVIESERPDVVMQVWAQRDLHALLTSTPLISKAHEIALPEESEQVRLNIESVQQMSGQDEKLLQIRGWGFIEGQDSEDSRIYVVLKSAEATYVFDTTPEYRPDVTAYFEELGMNLDSSGFVARIPKEEVETGNYKVGLYIENDGARALRFFFDQVLEISEETVRLSP